MTLSEQAIIRIIRQTARTRPTKTLRLGIGDDCAILAPPPGHEILVTTDLSLESRHFRRDWHTPQVSGQSAGHRCLARGLSDLAAMGAKPLAAFLSLALPPGFDPKWLDRFLAGLLALATLHAVPLAGGDTAQAPGEHILADIVLLGSAPAGRALRRSTARPGDRLFVSGALGGAAAELETLAQRTRPSRTRGPQTFPEPRLALGQALLRRRLASACIDLSDGLSTDLTHLCQASGVQAILHAESLPLHPLASGRLALALHGGEDYELLFTAPPSAKLPRTLAGVPLTEIGRITRRSLRRPVITLESATGSQLLEPAGWEHFRSRTPGAPPSK
jgi:thiamine-monophosphate kinase